MRLIVMGENYLHCHHVTTSLARLDNIVDYFSEVRIGICSLSTVNYCAAILVAPSRKLINHILEAKKMSNIAFIALHEDRALKEMSELYNAEMDDYMHYSVDLMELQARIKFAVLRRNVFSEKTLTHREIKFNLFSREVYHSGKVIHLTIKEKCLLEVFFLNKGRILSKLYLEDKLFPWGQEINSNVLQVYISSLRKS